MHPTADVPSGTGLARPRLGYRPELDGMRGLGLIGVVVFHTLIGHPRGAWVGLDMFFVLSGFLITTLLLEEHERHGRVALGAFYARRALRLLPAVGVLLSVLLVADRLGLVKQGRLEGVPWVLAYVANWPKAFGETLGPLTHMWSLSLEEQFYVVWPVVLVVLLRFGVRPARIVTAVALAAITIAIVRSVLVALDVASVDRAYHGTDLRFDAMLYGCITAIAWRQGWIQRLSAVWNRLWWPALAVMSVVFLTVTNVDPLSPHLYGVIDVASALVICGLLVAPERGRLLRWWPLVRLGAISYGVYLWHVPIMWYVGGEPLTKLLVLAPLSVVVAALSYRFVEGPALRLKARFSRVPASAEVTDRGLGQHLTEPAVRIEAGPAADPR